MSTLLKKKYMQGRLERKATADAESCVSKDVHASAKAAQSESTLSSTGRKRKLDAVTLSAAAGAAATTTPRSSPKVSFVDSVTIISPPQRQQLNSQGEAYHPPLDADTLQLYRNDIWYTRHEYRNFWKDRMDSVRLYRSVNGDLASWGPELLQQYTIRGLESYVMNDTHAPSDTSGTRQQQRDVTTSTVLDQQECERIRPLVAPWSALAMERAQRYAAQDAYDAYAMDSCVDPVRAVVPHHHSSDGGAIFCGKNNNSSSHSECPSPPSSPSSVLVDVNHASSTVTTEELLSDASLMNAATAVASAPRSSPTHDDVLNIKTLNQQLIQHMQQEQHETPSSSISKKPRRRTTMPHVPLESFAASTHGMLSPMEQRRLLVIAQRRNSMQLARLQQEQLQLEQQKQDEERRRRHYRRRSMSNHQPVGQSSDYDRHMTYCSQLLQSHQQLATTRHSGNSSNSSSRHRHQHSDGEDNDRRRLCGARHRDSLALGLSHYYHQRGDHNHNHHDVMGGKETLDALQDEYIQSLGGNSATHCNGTTANGGGHRDSLRLAYPSAHQYPHTTGDHASYRSPHQHHGDNSRADALLLPTQQSSSPQSYHQQQMQPEATYTDSVTSLSRLRRDSLFGGHY